MSDTLRAEFLAWMSERERREREQGEWWLTPDGRKCIRETWDSPIELDAPPVLLTALEAAEAERDALRRALTRLCTQFPTDSDLLAAGWENDHVSAACDAYDAARAALASASPPTPGSGPVDWDEIAGGERLAWGNDAATFNAGVDAMLAAVKRAAGSGEPR